VRAVAERCPLHVAEEQILGFTHAEAGGLLAEHWGFSEELCEAVRYHHNIDLVPKATPLVFLVHLSDLLCRLRNLTYGYDEILSVAFPTNPAWTNLLKVYPALADIDLVRFALDIDGSMEQIASLVDAVFAPAKRASASTT